MKRLIVFCLSFVILLACVPTPEVDAVKQKDTNVLIDTVRSEEQEQQQAAVTLPPVKEQVPERFLCDFTTSVQNVHVVSDVPIEVLTDGVFPMLRVEHRTLSDGERLTLASRVFGTDALYIWQDHLTRKDLERIIRDLMQEPTPEEKAEWMRDMGADEAAYSEMLERRKETLAEYQRQYNELPADDSRVPLQAWDGSVPAYSRDHKTPNYWYIVRDRLPEGYLIYQDQITAYADEMDRPMSFCVAWQNENDVTWTGFFDDAHKASTVRIDPGDYDRPHEDAFVSPNDAIQKVQALFSGIADLVPTEVFWANNAATDGDSKGTYTRWGYLIHFTQRYGDAHGPYCSSRVYDQSEETVYVRSWAYESVAAVVDGEGNLLSFDWNAPYKVTETIASATTLLPFEKIQSIFETQMNRIYINDDERDGTLTLEGVQLGLFRIREQNDMEHGLLVPVWFFTGTFAYTNAQRDTRISRGYNAEQAAYEYSDDLNPLLIINAIDGTIISPFNGY